MNLAARELGLIHAAHVRAPILAKARQLRAELGLPPHPALDPLLLTSAERVTTTPAKGH